MPHGLGGARLMADSGNLQRISPDSGGPTAGDSAPGRANPAALTVAQLARTLGIDEDKVRAHLAAGAPAGPGSAVNLVHYVAWLNKELAGTDGD
jgi:hypothetical protein